MADLTLHNEKIDNPAFRRGTLQVDRLSTPAAPVKTPYFSTKFPVMISEEEIAFSAVNSLQSAGTTGQGICVLLAEDDKALRRYLEIVLERSGYSVEPAADGLEAMKILLSKKIDLVITDAVMPNLTGYELCRFIRSTDKLSGLPIVLLSALDPKNAVAESEQADAFLAKPVSPEDLLQTLGELMS